ncbi:MAG: DUF1775 domain-containing protein [Nitriliruptoraceae bacterium]
MTTVLPHTLYPDQTTGGQALSTRTLRRALLLGCVLLLVAPPAWAHPSVQGGEAPVDSLATVTLAMAHGCGSEQSGGGDPTIEVALEVPDQVRVVDAEERDGWDVALEQDAGGRITVVTWVARDAQEAAPAVEFRAVFSGAPGDEVYLKVFQGCDGFAYRWIGTPDEPAADPAVRVRLTEADPDNPPPAEAEPEPEDRPDAAPGRDEAPDVAPPSAAAPVDGQDEGTVDGRDRRTGFLALAVGIAILGGGIWIGRRLRG